ncbi:uncharacterized protein LOC143909358 [Arctopsyche grandis]|uniref:uncharacterized protein LOC143909358 n=1 Tax=Arctopsyche grandis TaxID=121162 RepID=UPI00406D8E5D
MYMCGSIKRKLQNVIRNQYRKKCNIFVKHFVEQIEEILNRKKSRKENKSIQLKLPNDRDKRRYCFVTIACDVFQSFEFQLLQVTSKGEPFMAINKFAEDAAYRFYKSFKDNKDGDIDAKRVLCGKSKLTILRKPGQEVEYSYGSTQKEWRTSYVFEMTGLALLKNGERKFYSSNASKHELYNILPSTSVCGIFGRIEDQLWF